MSVVQFWMQRFRIAYGNDSIYLYIINYEKERFFSKKMHIYKKIIKKKSKFNFQFACRSKNIAFPQKSA